MNPSYNEREVLALLQEESTQKRGFEMIVAQYSEQLYWQIRRMVLSHEDANDLLQNTFVKAWLNIDYFRAEAKLSTWLYRIALNECLTFLNNSGRRAPCRWTLPKPTPFRSWRAILTFGRQSSDGLAESVAHLARKATHGVQPEVLPGNEIRADVRYFRYFGGGFESVLPPCRKKIEKILGEED